MERINSFFEDGDDVHTAKERNLEFMNSELNDVENAGDNGAINPPTRVLQNMYKKYVNEKLGGTTWPGMIQVK